MQVIKNKFLPLLYGVLLQGMWNTRSSDRWETEMINSSNFLLKRKWLEWAKVP